MYDVIVIGAGPAGATAAKILAENGLRVLLAEKYKMPRYKSCSGQLIKKSLTLVERYFGEPVPSSTTCRPAQNRGMVFTDDAGRSFLFEQPGLNVWRSSFDSWLATKAAAAGANLIDELTAISCRQGIASDQEISLDPKISCKLSGDYEKSETDAPIRILFQKKDGINVEESARYVIDCEGVTGTIMRQLTGAKPDYITTYQTFNTGSIQLDPHYFYAYLQPELSEYDAWFNVKDDLLVLGVSVKNKSMEAFYYAQFLNYMKEKHGLIIDREKRVDRWLLPYIKPSCPICHGVGRVLFAGEAAGFLNPMGEGISAAMESAACAADTILQNFTNPTEALSAYRKSTSELSCYMKRQWSLVGTMAKTFSLMR